jgi:hypothetical protein
MEELERAETLHKPNSKVRYAENMMRQAEAYFFAGQYEMVGGYVEEALAATQEVGSSLFLGHLDGIYRALSESRYGKDPEVARLGIKLLKARRRELFG